jgi:predicted Na+-dependent transporter
VLATFAMGLATDPHRMLQYVKKPIGPLIGMACQFGLMPCIAIAFISTVPIGTYEALVIILYGCAPGGGLRFRIL